MSALEIKRLYDQANAAHKQAVGIMDEGEITPEGQGQVDALLDDVERLTVEAKRLERVGALRGALDQAAMEALRKGPVAGAVYSANATPPVAVPDAQAKMLRALSPFFGKAFAAGLDPEPYREYHDAFISYLVSGKKGLAPTEEKALAAGEGPAGGYLVRDTFLNVLLVASRQVSAMRRICRVLPPVPSGSVIAPTQDSRLSDATWTSEGLTGIEDTVKPFGNRRLTPHPLAKRIKVSNTLMRTPTFDIEAWVRDEMAYKFGIPEEHAFINGTGLSQPLGLLAPASGIPAHPTAAATTVTSDDVINWVYKLPAAYAANARILCNRAFIRKVRTLKAAGTGEYMWQPGLQIGSPSQIVDVPYEFSDQWDDALNSSTDAWEANGYAAIIGDFSNYWIVDALQMTIQRLDELYAETNQTGYIGRKECDGQVVLPEAFCLLKIKA
jgi:HK97 family phage major capsid protein